MLHKILKFVKRRVMIYCNGHHCDECIFVIYKDPKCLGIDDCVFAIYPSEWKL